MLKGILAFTFGFYEKAENILYKLTIPLDQKKSFMVFPIYLYYSLILYLRYESTGYRRYLYRARKFHNILKCCHVAGNPNAAPHLRLAQALELSVKAKASLTRVRDAFSCAIELLEQAGLTHFVGIANELAGYALAKLDGHHKEEVSSSSVYLQQAVDIYQYKWGATAKSRWLAEILQDK